MIESVRRPHMLGQVETFTDSHNSGDVRHLVHLTTMQFEGQGGDPPPL